MSNTVLPNFDNPVLRLQRRIQSLERRLDAVAANSRPTIPIYSPQDLSDFVDQMSGEYWIDSSDHKMYFLADNNVVKQVTSTP